MPDSPEQGDPPAADGRRRTLWTRVTRARAGVRYRVALLLPLIVLALIFAVSYPGEQLQRWILAVSAVGWVLLVAWIGLPDDDAAAAGGRLRRALTPERRALAVGIAGAPFIVLYAARGWVLERAPGNSWSGLALTCGVLLAYAALGLQLVRFTLRRHGGLVRSLAASLVIAGWPVATILLLSTTDALEHPPLWKVALVAFAVPVVAVVAWVAGMRLGAAPGEPARGRAPARAAKGLARCTTGARPLAGTGDDPELARKMRIGGTCAVLAVCCAVASSALFLVTALRVPLERRSDETSQIARSGREVRPPASDADLLSYYSPVLRLDPAERWVAGDAWRYANGAETQDAGKDCPTPARPGPFPRREDPCLELARTEDTTPLASSVGEVAGDRAVFTAGTVYPRIVPLRLPADCGVGETCRLFEYWIFYPNNVWTSRTALGVINQAHQGDWERVMVGIGPDDAPQFVGYSSHCAGTWRAWSQAAVVSKIDDIDLQGPPAGDDRDRGRGRQSHSERRAPVQTRDNITFGTPLVPAAHPLVVVARGSHANYATTGRREPDWASCESSLGSLKVGMRNLSFAASALETTDAFGPVQIPTVARVADAARVLSTPWWWGPAESFHLGNTTVQPDGDHGPASPAYQGRAWDDPAAEILEEWDCEAGGACSALRKGLTVDADEAERVSRTPAADAAGG